MVITDSITSLLNSKFIQLFQNFKSKCICWWLLSCWLVGWLLVHFGILQSLMPHLQPSTASSKGGRSGRVATSWVGLGIVTMGPCLWLSILARGNTLTMVD
jgi:hypothetical protein